MSRIEALNKECERLRRELGTLREAVARTTVRRWGWGGDAVPHTTACVFPERICDCNQPALEAAHDRAMGDEKENLT